MIRLAPKGYPCFAVASVQQPRALILISADGKTERAVEPSGLKKGYSIATWQFILQPLNHNATRLLVRQRLAHSPDLAWVWRLTEPVGFVMERQMMLGIRQRAEKNL